MYQAQPDSPDYVVASPGINSLVTTIPFNDLAGILAGPGLITLRTSDSDTTPETIFYPFGAVQGNSLVGITRGFGGTVAKAFPTGSLGCRAHTAYDHNTFVSNILDLVALMPVVLTGVETNVSDNQTISCPIGGTPAVVFVQGLCDNADPYMTYMQFVSPASKGLNSFTVNIKTNSGDPGNPMTIQWMAIL
jgi:hypothetical protein